MPFRNHCLLSSFPKAENQSHLWQEEDKWGVGRFIYNWVLSNWDITWYYKIQISLGFSYLKLISLGIIWFRYITGIYLIQISRGNKSDIIEFYLIKISLVSADSNISRFYLIQMINNSDHIRYFLIWMGCHCVLSGLDITWVYLIHLLLVMIWFIYQFGFIWFRYHGVLTY